MMKKLLLCFLAITSLSGHSQTDLPSEEVTALISEVKEISKENIDISVIQVNDEGQPLSYLLEKDDGTIKILGVIDSLGNTASGIVNAYAGYQTLFGVNAGLTLFKTLDIGVHARSNSLSNEGVLYKSVVKTGYHINIKYRPVEFLEIYTGVRRNKYASNLRGYGYSNLQYTGNTTEFVGGARFHLDGRQSLGIEAGYSTGLLTKIESSADYLPSTTGQDFLSDTKKLKAPILNLTYRITLFNH